MSQETNEKTLIGTLAPVTRRSSPTAGPQPSPRARKVSPTNATPTGTRPRTEPSAGAPIGGCESFIGRELCGYTILRKLAEGGMGEVFEGEHAKIGRRAALKVLKPELCRSEDVVERFRQEACAVNSIQHENIVDIYDFGRDSNGRAFLVMEYLEGEPLSVRLRRGALPWLEAFPILEQTLCALQAAHDTGFVHRDLKPDNIWLKYVDGRVAVKLLDFGIAKLIGTESPKDRLTQTGSMVGTPHYMSPEQINGARDIDHRTDIYAMGVIMHEMFTGALPFVGDSLQAIMTGHLFHEPPRLTDLPANLGVPPPIAEIVDRMLVKDARGRYESVTDVLADLHDLRRNQPPEKATTLNRVRPTRLPAPTQALAQLATPARKPRRSRTRAITIGGAFAVSTIVGVAIWGSQQESTEVSQEGALPRPTPSPSPPPAPAAKPLDYDALRADAQTTLRASLREAEPAVRVLGSDALGKIKDQPSVPRLTELTEKDAAPEVRGHSGDALGTIGASAAAPLLAKLEGAAPPPLKVWYASALARFGDKGAHQRLLDYARDKDLAVAFKATLTLAEISQPGDPDAIAALKALTAHEAELNAIHPYAGALILTKMAALRDASAYQLLYDLLDSKDEGARLAAAEGLAKLGDDTGRRVLQGVFANTASPNRLVAAMAQIPLGEYGGLAMLTTALGARDAGIRRLAARGLGDIGEPRSLEALLPLASDKDWSVRIAAAAAIVAIVGLDPVVLAQTSVDWTKSALDSQDWAVRKAAAGVLADIPEKDAVPLLAQAIADKDPGVRIVAARSAGRMRSAHAAVKIAFAVRNEADPNVKEQQVKALGEIGSAMARSTLAQISREPGRLGVIAAGSLIAVGDPSGKAKLEAAAAAPQPTLRLAAMQAASAAKNPIVVPALKIGVVDGVFEIRFTAAEGLASFNAEKAAAMPVLAAALKSREAAVVGRAIAALARFGEKIRNQVQTPAKMLHSTDARQRLAVVPVARALPPRESVPLLRRLIVDPDREVRYAAVEAIETVASKHKDQAIKLYKSLVNDEDPVVRSKAAGQLARLLPPHAKTAVVPPAVDDSLPKVQEAAADANAASSEAKAALEAFEALASELATATAASTSDDAAINHIEELAANLGGAAAKLEAVATKVEAAATAASTAAGATPSPDAAELVAEAKALAQSARDAAATARGKAADAAAKARTYVTAQTGDLRMYLAAADSAIRAGNFIGAQNSLDKATSLLRKSGAKDTSLDFLYGRLHDKMAETSRNPADKRQLLQQAADAYRRFVKTGTGRNAQTANERLAEIADELKQLGP